MQSCLPINRELGRNIGRIIKTTEASRCYMSGLQQVRKWSGKNILQDQGKLSEFYFKSGKVGIFNKIQEQLK